MNEHEKDAFVTVAMCRNLLLAQSYQDILAQNGIESFLPEENFLVQDPFMIPALGGVRLSVAEADVERAAEILKSAAESLEGPDEEGEGQTLEDDADDASCVEDGEGDDYAEANVEYAGAEDGEPQAENASGPRYLLGIVMIFVFAVAAYYTVNFLAVLIAK